MKTTRELPVQLEEEQIAELGRQVAKRVRERADLQEEKKQQNADINARLKDVSEIIRKTSEQIATGTAIREVECTVDKNIDTKMVTVTRDDTGEVIEHRPMTTEELQQELFDPRKPKRTTGDPLSGMGGGNGKEEQKDGETDEDPE